MGVRVRAAKENKWVILVLFQILIQALPSEVVHHHEGVLFRVVQLEFRWNLNKGLVKHENIQETFVGNSKIKMRKYRILECYRLRFFFYCRRSGGY